MMIYRYPETWPHHGDMVADVFADALSGETGYHIKTLAKGEPFNPSYGDVGVAWGMRPQTIEPIRRMAECGNFTIVLDEGYIARPKNFGENGYYQVNINGINMIPRTCRGQQRARDALKLAGLEFESEMQEDSGNILILGQVENDAQHGLSESALESELNLLVHRAIESGRKVKRVLFRPHPYSKKFRSMKGAGLTGPDETLQESIRDASTVITYNSTAAVEVLCSGRKLFCHPYSIYSRAAIEGREHLLACLAWSQWSLREIGSGMAVKFILNLAKAQRGGLLQWEK